MNAVLRHIETDDVTQAKKLSMTEALWVAKEVGVKKGKRREKKSHGGKKN